MSAAGGTEPLLRLRPLGLGEILDEIFRVYRRHFGLLWAVALVLSVPGFLLQVASGSTGAFGSLSAAARIMAGPAAPAGQAPLVATPNLGLLALAYLVVLAALPFTTGA
ncbi:MAG TPA: hypothetical protein VKF59_20080, partial [Candidatus Dormibacteraeota bacterium]|nr:hypothetical protein [Candidatus Dormibacteraeota bacterium]